MRKTLAIALMLTASLGLAACDKKSEDKAQDANQHAEQAQQDMNKAQDKVNDAAKENAAIEMVAIGDHIDLQDEVFPFSFGLDVAVAVLDVEFALVSHGELRFMAGNLFPAG